MKPFDRELRRYMDERAGARDDWEAIRKRASSQEELLATPYRNEAPADPPKSHRRLIAYAAAAAAVAVVATGVLVLAARRSAPPPLAPGGSEADGARPTAAGQTAELNVVSIDAGGAQLYMRVERYDARQNVLYVRLYNETADGYNFGLGYTLSRWENGGWREYDTVENWAVPDIAVILKENSEIPHSFNLNAYYPNGLEPGTYRLEITLYNQNAVTSDGSLQPVYLSLEILAQRP